MEKTPMNGTWSRTAVMAALLALGLAAGSARADGPAPPLVPYPSPDQPNALPPNSVPHPVLHRLFHPIEFQHPIGCPTHHDDFGCGSTQAEWVFIFGSCRDFWNEPCNKGKVPYPPKGPTPPGAGGDDLNFQRPCPFCR
jgi:hypothetical protein